jgi:hypothetical protein
MAFNRLRKDIDWPTFIPPTPINVDRAWAQGTTISLATGGAGNRMLIVVLAHEDTTNIPNTEFDTATLSGQSGTLIAEQYEAAGPFSNGMAAFYWTETQLAAIGGGSPTLTVGFTNGSPTQFSAAHVIYGNVNQSNPVVEILQASSTTGTETFSLSLDTETDGAAVISGVSGNPGNIVSISGTNSGDYLLEEDYLGASSDAKTWARIGTGDGPDLVDVDFTGSNRNIHVSFSLRRA